MLDKYSHVLNTQSSINKDVIIIIIIKMTTQVKQINICFYCKRIISLARSRMEENCSKSGPEVIKFFMLNSVEHEILNAYKY